MNYLKDLTDIIFAFLKNNKNWDAHLLAANIEKETEKLGYVISIKEVEKADSFTCPNCGSKEFIKVVKDSSKAVLFLKDEKKDFYNIGESEKNIEVKCSGCNAEIEYEKSLQSGKIAIKSVPLKFDGLELNSVVGLNTTIEEEGMDKAKEEFNKVKRSPIEI